MFFFNFFDRDREEEEQRKDACRRPARSSPVCSIFSGEETDGRLCVCKCSVRNCKEGIVSEKPLVFSPRRERYFIRNQKRESKEGNLSRP